MTEETEPRALTDSMAQTAKSEKLLKASLGIRSFFATSSIHGNRKSATMKTGWSCFMNCSIGDRSSVVAWWSLKALSRLLTEERFSTPGGRCILLEGNGTV